jgi:3-oxoacyl-[acyl-carrier protein] reductase
LGGPIDVFVANAGRPFGGPLAQADPSEMRAVIDTNITGTLLSAQAALASLRRSPRASLLLTGSLQSVLGRAERSVYTASKHAIAGMVKSLALEWGPLGVRVNGIAPTLVDTPFLRQAYAQAGIEVGPALARAAQGLPLGRIPTPEDFAHAAVFLASQEASAITGHMLMVDCGASAGKF